MDVADELHHWRTWQERCAIDRLEPDGRYCLVRAVALRFSAALRRYANHRGVRGQGPAAPTDAECAHLFETHCALHQRAEGKSYKHWLLHRGDGDLDSVQSGVTLLVRMVVRDWLRREHLREGDCSLDETPPGASQPLAALLPDEGDQQRLPVGALEWVESSLAAWVRTLSPVERKVLLVRRSGRELYHPDVRREYGVSKSTLYTAQRTLFESMAQQVRDRFPDIPPGPGVRLVLHALDRLAEKIV